jgi:hypothetical protein
MGVYGTNSSNAGEFALTNLERLLQVDSDYAPGREQTLPPRRRAQFEALVSNWGWSHCSSDLEGGEVPRTSRAASTAGSAD